MNRIPPDIGSAASQARQRPHTSDRLAASAPPATLEAPQQQDAATGQPNGEMITTTAEFQADGAP